MTTTTPTARLHERNRPVPTAPAPTVVTAEDEAKARKAIADLEGTERLVTTVLVVLGIGGLIFTAVNVTLFAIDHHTHPGIAWMLDPLVSLALLGVLFIDGKLAAHGYKPSGWPFTLRWFAGLATWLMNCWASLYPGGKFTGWPSDADPAGLLLHSVIPFLVILLAEAGAGYRKFSTGRKRQHQDTVHAFRAQQEQRRQEEAAEQRKREEEARQSAEADRQRTAELLAEEKRAAIETAKARDLAEAKAREISAAAEAEARRAEQARLDAEARRTAEAEARNQQAILDRQNAEHAAELERQRLLAEADAEARKVQAEAHAAAERRRIDAELKAAEDAREERRRSAEARRARTAETAPETTALPSPGPTAETRKLTALPSAAATAETDDVRGAEAKRRQIEEANFEAAVLLFTETAPTRKDFATRYGRGETWGRERYAEAERLLSEDADFAARVLAEAEQRQPSGAEDDRVSA